MKPVQQLGIAASTGVGRCKFVSPRGLRTRAKGPSGSLCPGIILPEPLQALALGRCAYWLGDSWTFLSRGWRQGFPMPYDPMVHWRRSHSLEVLPIGPVIYIVEE